MKPGKLIAAVLAGLIFSTCTKTVHDRRSNATVTPESREYFGCRINGRGMVSEASRNNVSGFCTYKMNYEKTSAYTFQIFSDKFESNCKNATVGITLDSVVLEAGKRYTLGPKGNKKNFGSYFYVPDCSSARIELSTVDENNNYVIIKSVNLVKKVVTGSFNFNVRDEDGNLFQITDGIFDRHFAEN